MLGENSKGRAWIYIFALLIVFMVVSYFSFSPELKQYPDYVTESPSPTGTKAFYTYLSHEKKVKKWTHSPQLLRNQEGRQLLIMAEPNFFQNGEETEGYISFMEAGNTILFLKKNPKGFFNINTFPVDENNLSAERQEVVTPAGIKHHAEISSSVRLQTNENDEILISDQAGTVALKRPFGNGQLVVANTPEWISNGKVLTEDHLPLLFSLLLVEDASIILFDEYIHGGENAANLSALYPMWFLLLIIQGGLLAILALWFTGKRFGPIYTPREEAVRFSDEKLRALAAWYMRGRRYHDSLGIQAEYVKLMMQEQFGIPYNKPWTDILEQLSKKWRNMSQSEIQAFLTGLSHMLEKDKVNKQEYLLWSKKLDHLRKEVEDK
ncbi:DUF4350 domain-containing protein [Cytobacillus depressus]|uniref:DUF4350 domain-containing protein n=1 Tax=Cytobacillus depressus TaxID=1602942 RepID=A0A6L3V507_9BACI|nr:DUF4350 domain-containing protein [Cytobacillus depressus]KAB2330158.1 DUF4350 domain-containing protein [Cytobacillus depressus]